MLGHEPSLKHYISVTIKLIVTLLAVTVGTIVLVAFARGYTFDVSTRQIIQTGLLNVHSLPTSSNVDFDGQFTNEQTPYQATPSIGPHDLKLSLEGYVSWEKRIVVSGSEVTAIDYPLLVPAQRVFNDIAASPSNHLVSISPNREWLLNGTASSLNILELDRPQTQQRIGLPFEDGSTTQITKALWLLNGRLVLLQTKNGTTLNWFLLEPARATATDITRRLEGFKPVGFLENNDERLVLAQRNKNDLWLVDLSSGQPIPLSSDVSHYDISQTAVAWHNKDAKAITVWSAGQTTTLPTLIDLDSLKNVHIFTFEEEVIIQYTSTNQARLIVNALNSPFERSVKKATALISSSPTGQFVLFKAGSGYITFDIKNYAHHSFGLENPISETNIQWAGSHILSGLTTDKKAVLFEFDGGNEMQLSNDSFVYAVVSGARQYVYGLAGNPKTKTNVLKRLDLQLKTN